MANHGYDDDDDTVDAVQALLCRARADASLRPNSR